MIYPKSLLMPLSTSGHVSERISGALSVAAFFRAHLDVLHAQVSPKQFLPNDIISMPARLLQELEQLADKHSVLESTELRTMFERMCDQQNVLISAQSQPDQATACWQEINGLRSELIAERGKVADLIIFPQSKTGKPTATFEAALMRSGKPVIVMPRSQTSFQASRIMIAWNGSTEIARTITHGLPLLKQAQNVVIAVSKTVQNNLPDSAQLSHYLTQHGIQAQISNFDNTHTGTGEALLKHATEEKTELLMMGAFTHRRLHEQIFGGVTRHVLANAEIPLFMMH